jgi:cystathionine gamma-synthase
MEQTLAMPYVYLAHYDLMQTEEGRKYLKENGINPDLLRLSV